MAGTKTQTEKNATASGVPEPRTAAGRERLEQIVQAAVKVINESGLAGFSLPAVAAEVGISHVGVLHYVGNKNALLLEVVKRVYDQTPRQNAFVDSYRAGGEHEGERPNLAKYCRVIVEENSERRPLVLLFHTLNSDSYLPDSPLHEYFANRTRHMLGSDEGLNWNVPEGIDGDAAHSCALATMYGLEGRWLARPDEVDLVAEWARFEDFLFPLPLWEGYR